MHMINPNMKLKHLLRENSIDMAHAPLTQEEKKHLYETIRDFNSFRSHLKANKVYETAQKIMHVINLAERYSLKESGDWMESKMISRDMKEIKRDAAKLYEEAQKIKEIEKNIDMLYEQIGSRLDRYYEINDAQSDNNNSVIEDPTENLTI